MSLNAIDFKETLLNLLPPVSYARSGKYQQIQAQIDAVPIGRIQTNAQKTLNSIEPQRSGVLLNDWERVLGLSNENKNLNQRIQSVLLKINTLGGLSIPYFTQLAKAVGYEIHITEPQPFRAGVNRAGHRLASEDIMFVWEVNVQSNSQIIQRFRSGSNSAGERLSTFSDAIIESVFQDLKPAHTEVRFTYQEQS